MTKINILFVGYGTNLGGIETFIYNIVKKANKKVFNFSFLVFKNNKKIVYFDELTSMGCKIFEIEKRTKNYFKYLKDLKKVYSKNKFDIIHFNLMDMSAYERITYADKYSNAKLIIQSHNGSFEFNKTKGLLSCLLDKIGRKKVRKINFYRAACGKQAGIYMFGDKKFEIFYNGIDFNKFKYSPTFRKQIRKEFNIDDKKIVIGCVAALLPVKNHQFLIDVVKEIYKKSKNIYLLLVGEGVLMNQLKEKVKEYNLQNNILFIGKRVDVYKIYSAFDIYVMPSISEGLSISMCEAQINGLKCITSDNVDRQTDISGNTFFWSISDTPKKWADKILKIELKRDSKVLNNIPQNFNSDYSYKKIYDYYINITHKNGVKKELI